jgi:iron uptake system component EfeO
VRTLGYSVALVLATLGSTLVSGAGCSSSSETVPPGEVSRAQKEYLSGRFDTWLGAAQAIAKAAPAGRGWDAGMDSDALSIMRAQWRRAHEAYQAIQVSVATVFPDLNRDMDQSYEDQLGQLGLTGDPEPFDDKGVIGMHAIERVLYADVVPEAATARENIILGYAAPAFPMSEQDAADFRDKLVGKLTADITTMRARLGPLDLDVGFAAKSAMDLLQAEISKLFWASGRGNEESRYSHSTLADVRADHAGCRALYLILQPRLASLPGGSAVDKDVVQGLARVTTVLATVPGDAIPPATESWKPDMTAPEDLMTAFGKLYAALSQETSAKRPGSLAAALTRATNLLRAAEER